MKNGHRYLAVNGTPGRGEDFKDTFENEMQRARWDVKKMQVDHPADFIEIMIAANDEVNVFSFRGGELIERVLPLKLK